MRNNGVTPNVFTYTTQLNKVQTLNEAHTVLADMRNDGIIPNERIYTNLLKRAYSVEDVIELKAGMQMDRVEFNYHHLRAVQLRLEHDLSCSAQQLWEQLKSSVVGTNENHGVTH